MIARVQSIKSIVLRGQKSAAMKHLAHIQMEMLHQLKSFEEDF